MRSSTGRIARRSGAILLLLCLLLSSLAGCQSRETPDGRISVVSTLFPYYDFAKAIAGDRASYKTLIRPGTDAHSFDPTPSDMRAIDGCDVFILTGGESDAWAEDLLLSVDCSKKTVIRAMDLVPTLEEIVGDEMTERGEEHGEEAHGEEAHDGVEYDEHVWTSPKNAILIAREIARVLCERDPDGKEYYTAAAASYEAELLALDEAFRTGVAKSHKKTIVFGDRFPFRYLAEEYGIDCRAAFPGCSSETEPSVHTMIALTDLIRKEQIRVIYTAEYSSTAVAEVLSDDTDAEILELHSCHSMRQEDIDRGETYLSVMYRNLENLKRGLSE